MVRIIHKIKIREARLSDVDSLRALLNIKELDWSFLLYGEYSMEYFKRLIESEEAIFLVADDKSISKIVGLAYGEFNIKEDWAELMGIAILERFRRKGIGMRFIRLFEEIIRNKRISFLEVPSHIDTLAKHMEKRGYKKGETYVYYRKELR